MGPRTRGTTVLEDEPPIISVDADPVVQQTTEAERVARQVYETTTTKLRALREVLAPPLTHSADTFRTVDDLQRFQARRDLPVADATWAEAGAAYETAKKAADRAREAARKRVTIARRADVFAMLAELHRLLDEASVLAESILAFNDETERLGGVPDRDLQFHWLHKDRPTAGSAFAAWTRLLRERGVIL